MDVHILGTHPGERSHRYILTTYVVNGELAIDAGALGIGLSPAEQQHIHTVLLTHSHMDHVATQSIESANPSPRTAKWTTSLFTTRRGSNSAPARNN